MIFYKHTAALALLVHATNVNSAAVQVSGKHGAVASEVSECSQAGVSILKAGGSAADGVCLFESSSQFSD